MKKVAVIDNYDSFTYNLVELMRDKNREIHVFRNDEFELNQLEVFDKIVLSPGPGLPIDAGKLMEVIAAFQKEKSMLGVCLGHQAIAQMGGAELYRMEEVIHGQSSPVNIVKDYYLTEGLPNRIRVGRYHSWAVKSLPDNLECTFMSDEGIIMGIRHNKYDLHGVQFHPESILTPQGKKMIDNFIEH